MFRKPVLVVDWFAIYDHNLNVYWDTINAVKAYKPKKVVVLVNKTFPRAFKSELVLYLGCQVQIVYCGDYTTHEIGESVYNFVLQRDKVLYVSSIYRVKRMFGMKCKPRERFVDEYKPKDYMARCKRLCHAIFHRGDA